MYVGLRITVLRAGRRLLVPARRARRAGRGLVRGVGGVGGYEGALWLGPWGLGSRAGEYGKGIRA